PPPPVPTPPAAAAAPVIPQYAASRAATAAPTAKPAATADGFGIGRYLYILLVLALIPLAWRTFHHDDGELAARFEHTFKSHPELKEKVKQLPEDASYEDLLNLLPGNRIEGALLARDSWMHWLFALAAGGAFFGLILLSFPRGSASLTRLATVGLFTATIGIFFLLAVQWVAEWTQGRILIGRSIIVIFFYIAKFIGYSYRAALDPDTSFFVSCFGFTFGVGMCEELCKALPLLVHYRDHTTAHLSWRAACMIGLISGVGFGVSEGITYASDFYNGISAGDVYLVRFISCV